MSIDHATNHTIAMLAALPIDAFTGTMESAGLYNEDLDEFDDKERAEKAAFLAEAFNIRPEWITLASPIVEDGDQYWAMIERFNDAATEQLAVELSTLASLDAATLDHVITAHNAFDQRRAGWEVEWMKKNDAEFLGVLSDDPDYRAFSEQTLIACAAEHNVDQGVLRQAERINDRWGRVGFDEVLVRFAERRDVSDAEVVYTRGALAALPTDVAMVERVIAAERAYTSSTARWCLDWTFDARNADKSGLPEEQPEYTAFARRLLALTLAEYDVTEAQLMHAVGNSKQYLGHDGIRASHMKRLAPRVAAVLNQSSPRRQGEPAGTVLH